MKVFPNIRKHSENQAFNVLKDIGPDSFEIDSQVSAIKGAVCDMERIDSVL